MFMEGMLNKEVVGVEVIEGRWGVWEGERKISRGDS